METPAVPALLIGALFVEKGLITQEQLDVALEEQQRTGNRLGEVLVERFGVSRLDLASALAEQWAEYERQGSVEQQESPSEVRDVVAVSDEWSGPPAQADAEPAPKRPIGEIFLERGMVSEDELEHALEEQRDSGRRLGEILVGQGNLSRLELASALADQWASFQKLRPPSASNGIPPLPTAEAPAPAPVMPTPEVSPAVPAISGAANDQIDALRARLETLGAQLDQLATTTREWLSAAEQATADRFASLEVDDASTAEIAAIATRVNELAESIASSSSNLLPADLPDRVEQLAATIAQQEAALEARLDELAQPVAGLDELRASLIDLAARVEQPVPSDEWREPLESLADDLRARITAIEQTPATRANYSVDALRDEIAALAVRIDAIPAPNADSRADVAALTSRLDELTNQPAEGVEELRIEIATLHARLNAIPVPADAWKTELDQVAENLLVRFERVETDLAGHDQNAAGESAIAELRSQLADLADRIPVGVDELRVDLESLSSRVASIPAPTDELPVPNDDWREALDACVARIDAMPENLRTRLERIDHDLAARAEGGAIADLAERVDSLAADLPSRFSELRASHSQLSERIDAIPPPSGEWRHELAQVAENLRARVERVETGLEQRPGLELLAGVRDELQGLAARVDADLHERDERAAGQSAHVEWLAGQVARIEGIEERLRDEIAPLVDGVVAPVALRLAGIEGSLEEHKAASAGLAPRVDDLAERLDKQARRIEKLRDDGPTAAQVAEALNARLEASETVATDAYASFDERLAALDGQAASASGRAAVDVESLRRELDDLRGATAAATETSAAQVAHVAEQLRNETAATIAAALAGADHSGSFERLDGLATAQAAALEAIRAGATERERLSDERFAALERSQAKRSDVRDLRDALARVEAHIAADTDKEDARVVAVEGAVRDGLAALAARMSESEGAYFQAGDSLRRSIEHLGSAIRGADAHRAPAEEVAGVAKVVAVATSFLAFAPTSEGYRLVELDGAAPVVGGSVEVPGSEAPLVVARLGASPLPFDRRPCAYLELQA